MRGTMMISNKTHIPVRTFIFCTLLGCGILSLQAHAQLQLIIDSLTIKQFPIVRAKIRVMKDNFFVTGLNATNFTVMEDGVVQAPIQATCNDTMQSSPVSVMLVIDRSGSMGSPTSTGLAAAQSAAKKFLDRLSPLDEAALISFATSVSYDQAWTLNKTLVKTAIDQLFAYGNTALWKAVKTGSQYTRPRLKKKVMIVLTDGENNDETVTLQQAINQVQADSVLVYTIGLGFGVKADSLRKLANATGGAYYPAPGTNDLDQIYQAIAKKLTSSGVCELSYISKIDCWNGSLHQVEIIVNSGGENASDKASFTVPVDSSSFSFVDLSMKRNYVVEQDSIITIPITLTRVSTNRPPKVFQFAIEFDPSLELLTADTTALSATFTASIAPSSKGAILSLAGKKAIMQPGELVLLTFHAKPTFISTKSQIIISKPDVQQFCTIASSTDGQITISGRCERALSSNSKLQKSQLQTNTPNPFNPSTLIHYTIGKSGNVLLRLFDAIGRELQTIVQQEMKSGEYTLYFDGSRFSSGRYFIRLDAEDGSDTRAIVLMK